VLKPGDTFGPSSWIDIPQAKIDAFAEATGDHQWIHVDAERAKDGPFGSTIGHGYLTLSLSPRTR
jgi:acyl dehydratase